MVKTIAEKNIHVLIYANVEKLLRYIHVKTHARYIGRIHVIVVAILLLLIILI
jgi:hypothetical protein